MFPQAPIQKVEGAFLQGCKNLRIVDLSAFSGVEVFGGHGFSDQTTVDISKTQEPGYSVILRTLQAENCGYQARIITRQCIITTQATEGDTTAEASPAAGSE